MNISVVSGGFDPIHSGHISYLKSAREIGDYLIVALNSDDWLIKKKKKVFMPIEERKNILMSLECVDEVISFDDDENGSCINALEKIKINYPDDNIVFCNGGDRNSDNIPEMAVKDITFKFGIGGEEKKNSSSWLLKNWKFDNEKRVWGSYYNFYDSKEVKVKELIVESGKGMSFQKHNRRNEIWLVISGSCEVIFSNKDPYDKEKIVLDKFEKFFVKKGQWHQITNPFKDNCHIIEIQYGDTVIEDDIERLDYFKEKK
ncbi:adenylyltransferase/cytidyltransferase family protein [Gammaproteobacteria bacterium]|jgi:cytidyltransferase-like protein|nr:adenylyltransferase/cytidyltransferase family protein [Gammaproteobacteria bacterium]